MISRRDFLGTSLGAGAALALTPELVLALQQPGGTLMQRPIPSTGERVPVVGLSFSNHPACADHAALREVLKTLVDNGGRVFDAMHGNASAEQFHATVANELGVQNKVFWSTRGTPPEGAQPGSATVKAHVETLLARLRVPTLDLVMLPPQPDPTWLNALKEQKTAGRVRYLGVQVIADARFPALESIMRNEPIDFIGVNYDVSARRAEEKILPLAQERKIGVMAFFPFSNNGGISCGGATSNLFARVGTRPLPEWAAEFDARTWAQFFLKYVISHPAITVARVGTTKPAHMVDNIGGGIGRLPDETTRKRMAALIDALPPVSLRGAQAPQGPGVLPPAILDRYVGEYKSTPGNITVRRYGAMLVAKLGTNRESVLIARSATRFSLGHRGPGLLEFQPDSAGMVTGLIYEQGGQKVPASRIR